jgi:3-oxoacyl-[acyl-carrier protein] reductase
MTERQAMMPDLTDRVSLVTGAGRGIGKAIAVALGASSAHVIPTARSENEIRAVAEQIQAAGGRATPLRLDLTQESSILSVFKQVQQRFGRLDVLVNNAGLGLYGPIRDFRTEDLDKLLAVNLRGAFLCCREALRLMESQKSGYIINVSSVMGFKAYANQAAYAATKHGLVGLTKALAQEAQPHGIRVSIISPGGVDTDLVRAARPDLDPTVLLQPDDIAQTVLYLLSLSDRASVDEVYLRRRASQPF